MQKPYSSVNGAGLVLVAMDSLISLLQGIKLSRSSFENGLPMYCIFVKMRLRYVYGSIPFAFAVSIRL